MNIYFRELDSEVEPGALQSQGARKPWWTGQDPRSSLLIPDLRIRPDSASLDYYSRPSISQERQVTHVTCKYIITMTFTKSQHQRQDHIYQIKFRLFSPDCFCHSTAKWTSSTARNILSRHHRRNQICFKVQGPHSPVQPSFIHTEIKASSPAPKLGALNTIPS